MAMALPMADDAWAANGAFAVDAADISEAGSGKLESWMSFATNTDFSLVANPSCQGENANWITLGTTIRFPPPGGKPARARSGHL
jgi:hypothetical protein